MTDSNTGGMFSKLINAETAQPKITKKPDTTLTPVRDAENEAKTIDYSPVSFKPKIEKPFVDKKPKVIKRKQISAYLSPDQHALLKQLYFMLNSGDVEVEKSEIVGLGIEVIHQFLSTKVPRYSSTKHLREYLSTQISRYLSTQVPKNSST